MTLPERVRALLGQLTEDCGPGPWHGKESGDRAAYSWWLENAAGDSSFPEPDDVATLFNALLSLASIPSQEPRDEQIERIAALLHDGTRGFLEHPEADPGTCGPIAAALYDAGVRVP